MITLHTLKNTSCKHRGVKRVGRGPGSGKGKTCGRGEKGAGSRSGYKRRWGYEGGQFRMFMKLPERGFNNERFRSPRLDTVNLGQIDAMFNDGDKVTIQTLKDAGFINGPCAGIKILAKGELKKKVIIEANAASESARRELQKANIAINLPKCNN